MGIKIKKSSRRSVVSQGRKRSSDWDSTEHAEKKARLNPGKQFVEALRGPNSLNALKTWLYLVSNSKERAQLDKESSLLQPAHGNHVPGTSKTSDRVETLSKEVVSSNSADNDGVEDYPYQEETESDEEDCCMEHIDTFLHAGGCPSDFLNILPPANNATYANCRHILKALSKVVLRIASVHQERISKTVKLCYELLKCYISLLKGMLENSKSFAQKRLTLEVITAMVVLDSRLGKEILTLPLLSGEIVKNLTSSAMPLDVRIAYLNFLVALLMEVDDSVINTVMNKPWLLTAIMDDLQYDTCQNLILLITTVQKSIVKNPHVTKTSKLLIFDSNTVLCLLRLYTWKGPQNRPRARSQWDVKKASKQKQPLVDIDREEAEAVENAVHDLLLVLLTDYRFGIVFRDPNIGFKGDRLNSLVLKVLQKIGQFWEHPKTSELISKVLAACPDALSTTMSSMEPFIMPRSSPKWFKCVDFLKQVIEAQSPSDTLERQAPKLSLKKLSQAAIEMCAPPHVVKALCGRDASALCDSDAGVAKLTLELLSSMLKKTSEFLEHVQFWFKKGIIVKSVAIRQLITDVMSQNFFSLTSIEKVWRHWSELIHQIGQESADQNVNNPSAALPVLSSLLEFLDSYRSVCPSTLEPFFSAQSCLKLSMTNTVLSLSDSEEASLLRNRFYRLLQAARDQSFAVENPAIRKPLLYLFRDLLSSSLLVKSSAYSVLYELIEHSRSLEGSHGEAFIWLSAFQNTFSQGEEFTNEFQEIIVESMMRATSQSLKYLDMLASYEEQSQLASYSSDVLSKNVLALLSDSPVQNISVESRREIASYLTSKPFDTSSVSPWVPALIEVLTEKYSLKRKKKRQQRQLIENFLSSLMLHLLFRFRHPLPVIHIVLHDATELLPSHLVNYLRSWLPDCESRPLEAEFFKNESVEVLLSQYFYSDNESYCGDKKVEELVKRVLNSSSGSCEVKSVTNMRVLHLVYFGVFHLTQWIRMNELSEERANRCQEMLAYVLRMSSTLDSSCDKKKSKRFADECLEVVLSHPVLLNKFSPLSKHCTTSEKFVTDLLIFLAGSADNTSENPFVMPYKNKMLSALALAIKEKTMLNDNPVPMICAFPLTFMEIFELLTLMSELPSSLMLQHSRKVPALSNWCHLAVNLLTSIANLRSRDNVDLKAVSVLSPVTVSQIAVWLIEMLKMPILDSSPLQQSILTYIQSCPQHTSHILKELLSSLLNANQLKTSGEHLAAWLSQQSNPREVVELLKASCKPGRSLVERPGVLLPVLGAVLKSEEAVGIVSSNWFKTIYDHLNLSIERSIISPTDHPDWLPANIEVIVILIEFGMSSVTRDKISQKLDGDHPFVSVERPYYLQLIVAVLKHRPVHLLQFLLRSLTSALKTQESVGNQSALVQNICLAILQNINKKMKDSVTNLRESTDWQEFIKLSLKLSLRLSDHSSTEECDFTDNSRGEGDTTDENDVSSLLLKVLSVLLNLFYSPGEKHEHIGMVYKLTTLHSEFVNSLMDNSPSKLELVNFLNTLVTLKPDIAESSHVPVLLAAYGASLNSTDSALLSLLQAFERTGASLSQYRPYLWGKEAANHYSVWSDTSTESDQTLWHQPKSNQVLSLLNKDIIKFTIANFPLHRKLNIDGDQCQPTDRVYDPAFYLPLFSHLLAPESPVLTPRFLRSGALALTFSCLASNDVAIRAAAYTTLARFLSNLHLSSGSNKQVLLHFMSSIQKGVLQLGERNPQLPSVSSVFLAQASLELANPLSNLYQSIMHFILAKPVMRLDTVPEFWTFLHSENVHYIEHRCWILRIISSGLRSRIDFELCLKVIAFKLLPAFYSCSLSDTETKLLVLHSLYAAVQEQYGACCLVRDYALISWLHQTIIGFQGEDSHLISEMVQIIRTLWKSLCLPLLPSIPQVSQPANKIMPLIFELLKRLSTQLGATTLFHFISTFGSLLKSLKSDDVQKWAFRGADVLALIDICCPFIERKRELYEIPKLGWHSANSDSGIEFLDDLRSCDNTGPCINNKLRECLKNFLILWVGRIKSPIKSELSVN